MGEVFYLGLQEYDVMMWTRLNVCAFGVAWGLAIGGSMESPNVQAQTPPSVKQGTRDKEEQPAQKLVATSPLVTDIVVTQRYVCQMRSQRHITIRSLTAGYLEAVPVREGQAVKQGDVLFKVLPILYKAKLDAELAEVKIAEIDFSNAKKLFDNKVVSQQEVTLREAKLAKAKAKAKFAEAELRFATVRAPFDGLLGRLEQQEGSLVNENNVLTTLSDNNLMWVYFHVPESRYLEYKNREGKSEDPSRLKLVDSRIELMLADGSTFKQDAGNVVTVEGSFNTETGMIPFRADFPNPDHLLRNGQSGTLLIRRTLKNVTVVPSRATFEVLDRRYVFVIGKDNVVHQREIIIQHEVDDVFVVNKGLDVSDRIVLDGGQKLREGDKIEFEFRKPEKTTDSLKTDRQK